ncbi:MAG: iron ABC transporter substrate-binding protein [Deltaproteobacteria bacterium]|nr:MAG: iron ABC transporter substrate-binding protein [Deltaproteobacteria bacterium]
MLMILSCSVAAAGKPNNPGAKPLDALGKEVAAQLPAKRVICSGAGCLRLLTYLQAQDLITGVDDMEGRRKKFDARPYAIANPQFKPMPIFGEFRGHDNPERILTLEKQPEVILKIKTSSMGYDPKELQEKTGIPVVVVDYGNLGSGRPALYQSLQTMGKVVGKEKRAEEIIAFIDNIIADLDRRTAHIPEEKRPTVFVGGVAFKGPHGLQSTEPGYPPFSFVHAKNMAFDASSAKQLHSTNVSKEQIVAWNPDYLFLDLATLQMGAEAGGLHELKTDPAYQLLSAANNGRVFGVLPYNWYNANYGSILANAYFIGKTIYPECFKDVDPVKKADEIYSFLVGKPVFASMNKAFQDLVFTNIPVK